jgi:hypothetical protein
MNKFVVALLLLFALLNAEAQCLESPSSAAFGLRQLLQSVDSEASSIASGSGSGDGASLLLLSSGTSVDASASSDRETGVAEVSTSAHAEEDIEIEAEFTYAAGTSTAESNLVDSLTAQGFSGTDTTTTDTSITSHGDASGEEYADTSAGTSVVYSAGPVYDPLTEEDTDDEVVGAFGHSLASGIASSVAGGESTVATDVHLQSTVDTEHLDPKDPGEGEALAASGATADNGNGGPAYTAGDASGDEGSSSMSDLTAELQVMAESSGNTIGYAKADGLTNLYGGTSVDGSFAETASVGATQTFSYADDSTEVGDLITGATGYGMGATFVSTGAVSADSGLIELDDFGTETFTAIRMYTVSGAVSETFEELDGTIVDHASGTGGGSTGAIGMGNTDRYSYSELNGYSEADSQNFVENSMGFGSGLAFSSSDVQASTPGMTLSLSEGLSNAEATTQGSDFDLPKGDASADGYAKSETNLGEDFYMLTNAETTNQAYTRAQGILGDDEASSSILAIGRGGSMSSAAGLGFEDSESYAEGEAVAQAGGLDGGFSTSGFGMGQGYSSVEGDVQKETSTQAEGSADSGALVTMIGELGGGSAGLVSSVTAGRIAVSSSHQGDSSLPSDPASSRALATGSSASGANANLDFYDYVEIRGPAEEGWLVLADAVSFSDVQGDAASGGVAGDLSEAGAKIDSRTQTITIAGSGAGVALEMGPFFSSSFSIGLGETSANSVSQVDAQATNLENPDEINVAVEGSSDVRSYLMADTESYVDFVAPQRVSSVGTGAGGRGWNQGAGGYSTFNSAGMALADASTFGTTSLLAEGVSDSEVLGGQVSNVDDKELLGYAVGVSIADGNGHAGSSVESTSESTGGEVSWIEGSAEGYNQAFAESYGFATVFNLQEDPRMTDAEAAGYNLGNAMGIANSEASTLGDETFIESISTTRGSTQAGGGAQVNPSAPSACVDNDCSDFFVAEAEGMIVTTVTGEDASAFTEEMAMADGAGGGIFGLPGEIMASAAAAGDSGGEALGEEATVQGLSTSLSEAEIGVGSGGNEYIEIYDDGRFTAGFASGESLTYALLSGIARGSENEIVKTANADSLTLVSGSGIAAGLYVDWMELPATASPYGGAAFSVGTGTGFGIAFAESEVAPDGDAEENFIIEQDERGSSEGLAVGVLTGFGDSFSARADAGAIAGIETSDDSDDVAFARANSLGEGGADVSVVLGPDLDFAVSTGEAAGAFNLVGRSDVATSREQFISLLGR